MMSYYYYCYFILYYYFILNVYLIGVTQLFTNKRTVYLSWVQLNFEMTLKWYTVKGTVALDLRKHQARIRSTVKTIY